MYIHPIKGFRIDRKLVANYGLYRQKIVLLTETLIRVQNQLLKEEL